MFGCHGGLFKRNSNTYSNGNSNVHEPVFHQNHGLNSSISYRNSRLPPLGKFTHYGESSRSAKPENHTELVAKRHKEAERRRRDRINSCLFNLRTLVPNRNKSDKASLLAEVVRRVKELKKVAASVTKINNNGGDANPSNGEANQTGEDYWAFPSDTDGITLEYCNNKTDGKEDDEDEPKKKKQKMTDSNMKMIKVTFSCEDRSDLLQDLTKAIKSVKAKVMKAEMAMIGGRTKWILMVRPSEGGGNQEGGGGDEPKTVLRRALKSVVDRGMRNAWNRGYYAVNQNRRFRHQYYL